MGRIGRQPQRQLSHGLAESHTSFGRMTGLAEAESNGVAFQKAAGKTSLAELRAMSADDLLEAFSKKSGGMMGAIVDGWFLPEDIYSIYSQGKQNDLALLTGGTNDEGGNLTTATPPASSAAGNPGRGRGGSPTTLAEYQAYAKATFGDKADELLKLYPANDDASAVRAYHDVNRDINFAGHLTWAKLQTKTGKQPAYIYIFSHIPPNPGEGNRNSQIWAPGAIHFSEVIYVLNNLRARDWPWTDDDRRVAESMGEYWSNFVKNMNPNGEGLTLWPGYNANDGVWMNIGDTNRVDKFNAAGVDFIASVIEESRRAKQ
jgi:para-nitrobenzyl esterase